MINSAAHLDKAGGPMSDAPTLPHDSRRVKL
jgi:hypothetical protein